MSKHIAVQYAFLEDCAEMNACESLTRSTPVAKIIHWRRRDWICVGSASSGARGYFEADLRLVVPEGKYHGRPYDEERRGHHFYTGKVFTCKGQAWTMTSIEVTLVPIEERS